MAFNLGLILEILKDIAALDPILQEILAGLGGIVVLPPNTIKAIVALRERSSRLAEKAKNAPVATVQPLDTYVFPPLGTKLSPAYNTLPYPSNADDQGYVNRYKQAAAQQTALDMTRAVKQEYLNVTFANWLLNYEAGRDNTGGKPPIPPKGFMAVVIQGEGGDLEFDIQQVDGTVCPIPKYAKIPSK